MTSLCLINLETCQLFKKIKPKNKNKQKNLKSKPRQHFPSIELWCVSALLQMVVIWSGLPWLRFGLRMFLTLSKFCLLLLLIAGQTVEQSQYGFQIPIFNVCNCKIYISINSGSFHKLKLHYECIATTSPISFHKSPIVPISQISFSSWMFQEAML